MSPLPSPPPLADARPGLTILAGFDPVLRTQAVRALLTGNPRIVSVTHDLYDLGSSDGSGRVRRVVRTHDRVLEDEFITLAHGCVSCTLREDVLPTLLRLAREGVWATIVLGLPTVVEPDSVVAALEELLVDGAAAETFVRLDSVVGLVSAATLVSDLESHDDLADRGLSAAPDDSRTVAEVVARQVEGVDMVVIGGLDDLRPEERDQAGVLVTHLNPGAHVARMALGTLDATRVLNTGRHDRETYFHRWEPGVLHAPSCACDCRVDTLVWRARRPFHPSRLHDALEVLVGPVLRSRGHAWLAPRPHTLLTWESAGGALSLSPTTRWLADAPPQAWESVSPLRRTAAAMTWDPYYGDREQALVLTGIDLDMAGLTDALDSCLLTDAELAEGQAAWRSWDDPFSAWLGDEDAFLAQLAS